MSEVVVKLEKASGLWGVKSMEELIWKLWSMEKILDDWRMSITPLFKQKGDTMDCGNDRGIKLIEGACN